MESSEADERESYLYERFDRDLLETGARLKGHFKLRSGRCGADFFQIAMLARKPLRLRRACRNLAQQIVAGMDQEEPEVVVGPALGGISIAHEVAAALAEMGFGEPDALYAQKARFDQGKGIWVPDETSETFRLLRGFDRFVPHKRILVVEDALTTGGSCGRVTTCLRELEANVVAVATVVQRGEVRVPELNGVPIIAFRRLQVEDWDPADCPQREADGSHLPYTPIPGKN